MTKLLPSVALVLFAVFLLLAWYNAHEYPGDPKIAERPGVLDSIVSVITHDGPRDHPFHVP